MGRDTKSYTLYQGMTESSYPMLFDSTNITELEHFLDDYVSGTVSSFKVSEFFRSTSDYVTDLFFLPVDLSKWGTINTDYVYIGNHQYTDYACKHFMSDIYASSIQLFSFTVTRQFNNFLDYAPYTRIKLYVPYFEMIELNPLKVYGNTVKGYVSIDVRTGKFVLYVYIDDGNGNSYLIESKETNIAIRVGIGFTNQQDIMRNNVLNSISLIGSGVNLAMGVATENPISASAGIGMITKTATQILQSNVEHLKSYKGANGNFTELSVDKNIVLIIERPQDVTYPNYSLKGGVCRQNLSLSTVTGYTEIGEIHFNPNGEDIYDDEIAEIEQLLRDGVVL